MDIFYSIVNEEFKQFQSRTDRRGMYHYYRFTVRRNYLYEDAYSEMSEQNYPGFFLTLIYINTTLQILKFLKKFLENSIFKI